MSLLRGVWALVDGHTRRRIVASAAASVALALLDTMGVLLVFPLIRLLVAPEGAVVQLPIGPTLGGDEGLHDAAMLAAAVAALFVLKSTLSVAFLRWNLRFVLGAEVVTATRVFASHLGTATRADGLDTPSLQRTLGDSMRKVFSEGLAYALPAIADGLVIVLLSTLVIVIAPVEALVAVLVFGVATVGFRKVVHARTARASAVLHHDQRRVVAISGEALRASREIALSGTADHFVREYAGARATVNRSQRTIALNEQLPRSFLEVCLIVCTSAVAIVAFARRDTAAAVAMVGTVAAVCFRVLPSLNRALLAASRTRSAIPSLQQVETDLAGLGEPLPGGAPGVVSAPIERVEARGLTVRVPGRSAPLLDHVDLEFRRGEIVGVLGPSGAGKTSLVNAVLGFLPPSAGDVVMNGHTRVTGPASWQRRAAYVPQDVVVFDASVRDNVAFGFDRDAVDDERVMGALRGAHLDGLLAELAEGLSTCLGEAGTRLSGGQRQRLGIARALYHDADLLVLDESTAGLDADTERRILTSLGELKEQRMILLVSHHRSVMACCDRLVVLDGGRVVATGVPDDVDALLGRAITARNDGPDAVPAASR